MTKEKNFDQLWLDEKVKKETMETMMSLSHDDFKEFKKEYKETYKKYKSNVLIKCLASFKRFNINFYKNGMVGIDSDRMNGIFKREKFFDILKNWYSYTITD
jgi:hypothetical protein